MRPIYVGKNKKIKRFDNLWVSQLQNRYNLYISDCVESIFVYNDGVINFLIFSYHNKNTYKCYIWYILDSAVVFLAFA